MDLVPGILQAFVTQLLWFVAAFVKTVFAKCLHLGRRGANSTDSQ